MMRVSRSKVLTLAIGAAAALVSVLQPFGYSPDYPQYSYFFDQLRSDYLSQLRESRFELGFLHLSYLLTQIFRENVHVYGFFVLIAIGLKVYFAGRFSAKNYAWIFLVFYFFKFFPLHELTQLRAAMAASLLVVVFYYYSIERYWIALSISLIAIAFHNSAGLVLPFFLTPMAALTRGRIVLAALIVYVSCYLISDYLVGFLADRIVVFEMYINAGIESRRDAAFSPVFFPEFFLIALSFVCWRDLSGVMKKVLAIEVFGFAVFYGFIDLGVVAVRGRELFSVLWIVFVAQFPFAGKKIRAGIVFFVLASVLLSVYLYFVLDFFASELGY
ncbi:EpsG-like putative glucosyltransferase [Variovorax beijingensis]|uniref:EpsG-like putative glucosyltransferase n=1 Tax=Variovorax beijingensis TaxID=2496117 RepID=A0A561C4W0_9BURK|nr:EpsG family protein [Variovorax beijingensis]TWD86094.1 EpsG-like putative glucosyltransferase [Variovorax beijingensis]